MEVQEIKNKTMKKYKIELTEYQLKALSSVLNKQAKEKVLFEWFYIERGSTDVDNLTTYLIHNNFGDIAFKKDWKDEWEFIGDLESLSNLNEIELTESAIKQIGLWKH